MSHPWLNRAARLREWLGTGTSSGAMVLPVLGLRLTLLFLAALALDSVATEVLLVEQSALRDLGGALITALVIGLSARWGMANAPQSAEPTLQERMARWLWEDGRAGWLLLGSDGRVLDANPFALSCLSLSRQGVLGKPLREVLPFGLEDAWSDQLATVPDDGDAVLIPDVRVFSSTLGVVHLEVLSSWIEAENIFLVQLTDVTGRNAADETLQQQELELQYHKQLATNGFCRLESGRVADCNDQFARLLDQTAEQMIGSRLDSALLARAASTSSSDIRDLTTGAASFALLRLSRNRGGEVAGPSGPDRARPSRTEPSQVEPPDECWVQVRSRSLGTSTSSLLATEDVTARLAMENSLDLARLVFDHIQEGLVVTDGAGRISHVNPALCAMLRRSRSEVQGSLLSELLGGMGLADGLRDPWQLLLHRGELQIDLDLCAAGDARMTLWMSASVARGASAEIRHVVATFMDVTERRRDRRRLEELALRDELTELPNRATLSRHLAEAIECARQERWQGAVLLIDLDRFKTVNDSMGHPAGDRLLRQVAQRLKGGLRQRDVLGRWGGDEFVVLLRSLSGPEEAAAVAARLVDSLDARFLIETDGLHGLEREIFIGASIGITLFPQDDADVHGLLQQADAAMYQAKAEGRGRVALYSPRLTEAALRRLENETRLRGALQARQFEVHYQPLVRSSDSGPCGVEALIRWRDPQRGLIAPAEFIPLAEETGLILPIGAWVIETVCAQLAAWRAAGVDPGYAAINLSSLQFSHPSLCPTVEAALRRFGLPAQLLELEITEGHLLDAELAVERLNRLKDLGVRIAIDDFGTGYSSLSYIGRFHFDKLKIDRSFIRGVPGDATSVAIVQTIVTLARALRVEVLAEGVETEAQFDFVREQGIDCAQGWLFAPALSVQDVEQALRGEHLPTQGLAHWWPHRPAAQLQANPEATSGSAATISPPA